MAAKKGNSPTTIIIGETNSPAEISTAPVRNLAVLPFCEERYFKIDTAYDVNKVKTKLLEVIFG